MNTHSPDLDQLAAALSAFQAEMGAIPKENDNPFFKSKFADLATVIKHAAPLATSHGLSVAQFPSSDDGHDALTTYLLHKSGQYIVSTVVLHLVKVDPQSQGSAITYARRYGYMAALGLVADNDDDGNAASQSPPAARARRTAPPADQQTGEIHQLHPAGSARRGPPKQPPDEGRKASEPTGPGYVSAAAAKSALLDAFVQYMPRGPATEAARTVWGSRGNEPMTEQMVDQLVQKVHADNAAERPFE